MAPDESIHNNFIDVVRYLKSLLEDDLRKMFHNFLAKEVSGGNVQLYHGPSEHGVDILATVDKSNDPFRKETVLYIQVKRGDISLPEWQNRIAGQLEAALRSTNYPMGTSKSNVKRLFLVLNGELKPEVHKAISNWNQNVSPPVEILDILGLASLFVGHYNYKVIDLEDLTHLLVR